VYCLDRPFVDLSAGGAGSSTDAKGKPVYRQLEFNTNTTSGEYELEAFSYGLLKHTSSNTGISYRDFGCSLHLKRLPNFYIMKGVIPLYSTVFLGCMSYFVEADELGTRLSLLFALFLTCFAIQWVVLERLPNLPFLTLLDEVAFSAVSYLFLIALGQCVTYRVCRRVVELPDPVPSGGTDAFSLVNDANLRKLLRTSVLIDREECAIMLDLCCGAAVLAALIFYSIGYKLLFHVRRVQQRSGMLRPWLEGPRGGFFKPVEGFLYRLSNLQEKAERAKSMGTLIPVAEW